MLAEDYIAIVVKLSSNRPHKEVAGCLLLGVHRQTKDMYVYLLGSLRKGLGSFLVSQLKQNCSGQEIAGKAVREAVFFWAKQGLEVVEPADRVALAKVPRFTALLAKGNEQAVVGQGQQLTAAVPVEDTSKKVRRTRRTGAALQSPEQPRELTVEEWALAFGADDDKRYDVLMRWLKK